MSGPDDLRRAGDALHGSYGPILAGSAELHQFGPGGRPRFGRNTGTAPTMKRWLPHPLLAASLFVMWLLLTQSFSAGQVILGAVVAVLAGASMSILRRRSSRIMSWSKLGNLAAIVVADVARSNIAVAKIVLSPKS